MGKKPTYEVLEQRVDGLEKEARERARLEKQMQLLSLAIEQSSEGIAVVDMDGDLEYLNHAFAKIHGYSIEELIGKNFSTFHTPEQIPSVEAAIKQIKETGGFKGEVWHVTRNGTEFATLTHNLLLRDEAGNPTGILVTLRDIADLKQAEERIKHVNLVLRAIQNVNQLINREKDRDKLLKSICSTLIENRGYYNTWMVLLDDNRKFIEIFESGLGKDYLPMVELLTRNEMTECGQKALKQSDVVVTKDPSSSCTDCPLAYMYSGRGAMTVRLEHGRKIHGVLCASIPIDFIAEKEEQALFKDIARDIAFALNCIKQEEGFKRTKEEIKKRQKYLEKLVAERTAELNKINKQLKRDIIMHKQMEESLRTSQEYTKNIINSSLDIIITASTDRDIVEFNKAAEKAFGYRRDDIVGKHVDILYANPQEGLAIHKKTIEHGKCEQGIINRHKNGGDFPCFLSASLLRDANGKVVGVMGISRDISNEKRSNEQIKRSLREKEVLLKEIHHRVKNNLQIISSLLDMRIIREDNKQIIDVFEDIRSKIQTMALIHSQLYESERFDRINMGNYVQELVDSLSSIFLDSGLAITPVIEHSNVYLSINQAIPCALVLNELIYNAFKHAFKNRKKGKIEISLKTEEPNKIILKVKDNGSGIPEEIDIFKTDSLGLKLMRNTVQDQLLGKIHLEPGVGTSIIVEFKRLEKEVNFA